MKNKLTEKDYDIICDALESYVSSEEYPLYSKTFSDDEVEKTFYKVQDLWGKAIQEREKTS
jgi:hypothetical protein